MGKATVLALNGDGMDRYSVSIIMPSLNVAEYIEESLVSVLNQTLTDIEVICVDAGSEDGTVDIIRSWAARDGRIKLIQSDRKSYGYQMNIGIRSARGEYIGIVETDDYAASDMFEVLYKAAAENSVDFAKGGCVFFWGDGDRRVFRHVEPARGRNILDERLDLDKNPEYGIADITRIWSAVYRREFLLENELWFNETPGASFQDVSFSVLVGLVARSCIYVHQQLYYYRMDRPGSSVRTAGKIMCDIDEMNYIEKYLETHNMYNNVHRMLVKDIRLDIYEWNVLRLSDEEKHLFIDAVKEEMRDYQPCGEYFKSLTDRQRVQVDMLTDADTVIRYQEKVRQDGAYINNVVRHGLETGGYVVVCAGRLYEKFAELRSVCGDELIKAVCDNNRELQGHDKCGLTVLGVEEAAFSYKDSEWLILNMRHADDIERQLCSLGVGVGHISKMKIWPEISAHAEYITV